MKKLPVMVTGVGGALGISILKALRMSDIPCKIIGINYDRMSAGFHLSDKAYTVPDARREPGLFLKKMTEICRKEKVKIVFPDSDDELRLFAENKEAVEKETGALLLVNRTDVIGTACDKWQTVLFLQSRGLPAPDSVIPDKWGKVNDFILRHNFPLVVKPRYSSGSKGLFTVNSKKELKAALNLVDDALVQEFLSPPDEEYTVGVFMEDYGQYFGSIIFQRTLVRGLTYKATVVKNPEIEKVSRETAVALRAIGPVNIQLRLTEKGPVIFEINPRISSSTVIRAHFGFNEPELAIRRFVLGKALKPPSITEGTALRYYEEIYI